MKVVNLSRHPFLNRRPVRRAAIALWAIGGLILLANLWLYGEHFRGSSVEREKLDAIGRQIEQELERLDRYGDDLKSVRLGRNNARARALNRLIHKRTFPWSALFDDLERVLPTDVFLDGVAPTVQKEKVKRRRTRRRSLTPAEARRRAQARARGEEDETAEAAGEPELPPVKQDRILLDLNATAKSEDAMFELVTNLYEDPSFEKPFLGRESAETPGQVRFSIRVVYRTRAELLEAEGESTVDTVVAETGVDAEGAVAVETIEDDDVAPTRTAPTQRAAHQMPSDAPPAEGVVSTETRPQQTSPRDPRRRSSVERPRRPSVDPGQRRQINEDEMARRQAQAERTRQQRAGGSAASGVSVLGVPATAPQASESPNRGSSRVSVAPPRDRETSRPSRSATTDRSRRPEPMTDAEPPPASTRPAASATPRLRRNR